MLDQRAGRLFTGGMSVVARRVPVVSTYHGVEVSEDYRWLEDASSPETIAWTQEQAELTREYFASIPWREDARTRVDGLLRADRSTYTELASGGTPTSPEGADATAAALPGDADRPGRHPRRAHAGRPGSHRPVGRDDDRLVRAPAGWERQVAVSMSEHGTEDGTLHVFDVASGEVVDEPIPHVHLMGGSMAWRDDGSGFWYTLCADPAGFRQQVWFRDLGGARGPAGLPGRRGRRVIAENVLSASPDGRWLMDRVQKGDGGEWQIFLRTQDSEAGNWWLLADIPDNCPYAVLGTDAVYLLSRRDAPHGRILRLPLTRGRHRRGRRGDRAAQATWSSRTSRDRAARSGSQTWTAALSSCARSTSTAAPCHRRRSRRSARCRRTPIASPRSAPTGLPGRASPSPSRPRGGWRRTAEPRVAPP